MARLGPVAAALSSWPFVLSLLVLLLNDWLLKPGWPGWLSGKLSDVAGLFLVTLLLVARWPARRVAIYAGLALSFGWWKSEAASPFIAAVQSLGLPWFGRTVDLTDLWALAVLPLAAHVATQVAKQAVGTGDREALPAAWLRRHLHRPLAAVTLLALMGTSQAPRLQYELVLHDDSRSGQLHEARALALVDAMAQRHGLSCSACANAYETALYTGSSLRLEYRFQDANTWVFEFSVDGPPLFSFERSPFRVRDELEAAISNALRETYRNISVERRPRSADRRLPPPRPTPTERSR